MILTYPNVENGNFKSVRGKKIKNEEVFSYERCDYFDREKCLDKRYEPAINSYEKPCGSMAFFLSRLSFKIFRLKRHLSLNRQDKHSKYKLLILIRKFLKIKKTFKRQHPEQWKKVFKQ